MTNNDKMQALIEAALNRYSHEELFAQFLETITAWKDREAVAKLIVADELLTDDVLNELDDFDAKITDDQTEHVKSIMERKGCVVFECKSLVEQMKVEEFITDMKANPYQLKLIA